MDMRPRIGCLRLLVVAPPEPATAQLLAHLRLRLPQGPRIIANVMPKARRNLSKTMFYSIYHYQLKKIEKMT